MRSCYQFSFNNQIWCGDAKCHFPASAVPLLSKDVEGEIHPSSDIESQKSPANSGGTIV